MSEETKPLRHRDIEPTGCSRVPSPRQSLRIGLKPRLNYLLLDGRGAVKLPLSSLVGEETKKAEGRKTTDDDAATTPGSGVGIATPKEAHRKSGECGTDTERNGGAGVVETSNGEGSENVAAECVAGTGRAGREGERRRAAGRTPAAGIGEGKAALEGSESEGRTRLVRVVESGPPAAASSGVKGKYYIRPINRNLRNRIIYLFLRYCSTTQLYN